MASKKKRALNGALIGATAAALTVKGALAGTLGAVAEKPIGEMQNNLRKTAAAAVTVGTTLGARLQAPGSAAPTSSPPATPSPASAGTAPPITEAASLRQRGQQRIKTILRDAAARHGLDPRLVLAVSYWESGWDQSRVSATGAVGLMQVEPSSAQEAGPALLGRAVDINDPYDNADVGAAILREDLDHFHDPAMALAAYYQGPTSLVQNGMLPDTQQYVDGILSLATDISG